MRSALQQTLLTSLVGVLRPIVSLCLRCGIGYNEFKTLIRGLFVSVASDEYGLRGRPTNISRIAAMTGISRKEIKKFRTYGLEERWTPAMEISPANLLLHYWHFDRDFSDDAGTAAPLPIDGPRGFSQLARRYAGDIPAGAIKEELKRTGVITENEGILTVRKRYFQPAEFDEDFIRNIAFSLKNLACTVAHNANLASRDDYNHELNENYGRFERFAWSDHLSELARQPFRVWVRQEGAQFIEKADSWIGRNEFAAPKAVQPEGRTIGVGVYFFEED